MPVPKKMLVITSSFPRWTGDTGVGGGSFVLTLAGRLASSFDVSVLAPGDAGAMPYEKLGNLTVHRHRQGPCPQANLAYGDGLPANLSRSPWKVLFLPFYLFFLLLAIRRIVRQKGIDVIHAHWLFPSGFAAVMYKYFFDRHMRVLITGHRADITRFNSLGGGRLKRWILQQADAVSVVSVPLADAVRELGYNGPLTVCPMGVDTNEFSPACRGKAGAGGNYLLFVGTIIERKGIELLINAMPAILKIAPQISLVVIGEGHDKERMMNKTRQLGVEPQVRFAGVLPHSELPPWFAGAEALLLPSCSEGYPMVVMEALSAGTIPIVSPLPVFQEIQAECPCLVLMRGWSAEALAEAVTGILNDKEQLQKKRLLAREYAVRCLDWKIVSSHYRNVLQSLLLEH